MIINLKTGIVLFRPVLADFLAWEYEITILLTAYRRLKSWVADIINAQSSQCCGYAYKSALQFSNNIDFGYDSNAPNYAYKWQYSETTYCLQLWTTQV